MATTEAGCMAALLVLRYGLFNYCGRNALHAQLQTWSAAAIRRCGRIAL